ncbi:MAG: DUF1289 domain-containing protein [Hyphomicrobiaceae bacterium]
MQSPCVDICTMDPATGLCIGCGRTLDEIACWSSMSEADRRRIMAGLDERRRRAGLVPSAAAASAGKG